jgi:hypothetical protein
MLKMAGTLPGKSSDYKRKNNEQHNDQDGGGGRSGGRQGNNRCGGRGGSNNDNNDHLKNIVCYNCDKKGHYSTDCRASKKNGNEESNMVSKAYFKIYGNPL